MSINNPKKLFNVLFCITIKNSQHLYAVFLIFSLAISDDSQVKWLSFDCVTLYQDLLFY